MVAAATALIVAVVDLSLEQVLVVMFAGGPGLAALLLRAWEYRGNKPKRNAEAAQVLTNTATGLLDRMQDRIDHLETELREAERKIDALSAELDASRRYGEDLAREKERRELVEMENTRLRSLLPGRNDNDDPIGEPS